MVAVTKIVLDVLKPHQPGIVDFSQTIAGIAPGYQVHLTVIERDERTETVQIEIQGAQVDLTAIENAISETGGAVHSIDEVVVHNTSADG